MGKIILTGLALLASTCGAEAATLQVTVTSSSAGYYSILGYFVSAPISEVTSFSIDLSNPPLLDPTNFVTAYDGGLAFSSKGFGDYSGMQPDSWDASSNSYYSTFPWGESEMQATGVFGDGAHSASVIAFGQVQDPAAPPIVTSGQAVVDFWLAAQSGTVLFSDQWQRCGLTPSGDPTCDGGSYADTSAIITSVTLEGTMPAPVPEPADFTLLLGGLGMLGLARRLRRHASSRYPTP